LALALVPLATVGAVGVLTAPARADGVPGPTAPATAPPTIEPLAPYVEQTTCDPVTKPGTQALSEMVLTHYDAGWNGGYVRDCESGGVSEHKEGRAWDWMLRADDPAEGATGEQFLAWLTATGPAGEDAYNARRLGVMYVIWNHRIWSAEGWRPYQGSDPHTGHLHISLSWTGALRQTSWWTGVVGDVAWRPPVPAATAASTPPTETPPPPEPPPPVSQYTVVPGDTLGHIALAHEIAVADIMAANELTSTVILSGQVLAIPASRAVAGDPAGPPGGYTVASGDTLGHIALAHGLSVADIMAANHMMTTVIRVGQVLVIPDQS
jgi:LysM repeat protein